MNARIGAVHEDGAKRQQLLEQLCADVEILARASVAELEAPKKSARNWNFSQWLFGTDDWIRASWEKHMKRKA
jgi:hypothetical protein